jgi:hypothetical protein
LGKKFLLRIAKHCTNTNVTNYKKHGNKRVLLKKVNKNVDKVSSFLTSKLIYIIYRLFNFTNYIFFAIRTNWMHYFTFNLFQ